MEAKSDKCSSFSNVCADWTQSMRHKYMFVVGKCSKFFRPQEILRCHVIDQNFLNPDLFRVGQPHSRQQKLLGKNGR